MEKVGRNDPCPCGSGKKFKKCCEAKVSKRSIGNAQVITGKSNLSSLFNRRITPIQTSPPSDSTSPSVEVPPDEKHLNL